MPNTTPSDPMYSKDRYDEHRGGIQLHMSHFFLRYLNDIYKAFDGDLAMVIVLGEISHHNTTRFFSPEIVRNEAMQSIQNDPATWEKMDGCNAYSMSCATGIPRETVRRKIAEMVKRGWLEEIPKQGLLITQACADHFGADFTLRFLNGLLRASRSIEALLADEEEANHGLNKQPSSDSKPKPAADQISPQPETTKNPKS